MQQDRLQRAVRVARKKAQTIYEHMLVLPKWQGPTLADPTPSTPALAPRGQPSVRDVTGWLKRHPDSLNADQTQQLKAILARCPEPGRTPEHMRAFTELMNNRQGRHLDQWIERVRADDLPALHRFANGLDQDVDAVVAGLSLRYSSGIVEGHNNKVNELKRQMFGRANFDPLRKRILLAARCRS